MGGAGHVELRAGGLRRPAPARACTSAPTIPRSPASASQYAGWAIKPEGYFAMGSGPLRAIARVETPLFDTPRLRRSRPTGRGVLVLETRTLPDAAVADWIAREVRRRRRPPDAARGPDRDAARPASRSRRASSRPRFTSSTSWASTWRRSLTGFGTAPLAPVAKNDMRAIGRTNDCVLYGGTRAPDASTPTTRSSRPLAPQIPSSASRDYGTPFYDLFKRYEWDFYKVDPHLFSPAQS